MGLPPALLMLPVVWLWLTRGFGKRVTAVELSPAESWTTAQKRVLTVFTLTALAWMTRSAPWGGWSSLIGADGTAGDSTVALLAALVLFILPSGR